MPNGGELDAVNIHVARRGSASRMMAPGESPRGPPDPFGQEAKGGSQRVRGRAPGLRRVAPAPGTTCRLVRLEGSSPVKTWSATCEGSAAVKRSACSPPGSSSSAAARPGVAATLGGAPGPRPLPHSRRPSARHRRQDQPPARGLMVADVRPLASRGGTGWGCRLRAPTPRHKVSLRESAVSRALVAIGRLSVVVAVRAVAAARSALLLPALPVGRQEHNPERRLDCPDRQPVPATLRCGRHSEEHRQHDHGAGSPCALAHVLTRTSLDGAPNDCLSESPTRSAQSCRSGGPSRPRSARGRRPRGDPDSPNPSPSSWRPVSPSAAPPGRRYCPDEHHRGATGASGPPVGAADYRCCVDRGDEAGRPRRTPGVHVAVPRPHRGGDLHPGWRVIPRPRPSS